MEAGEAITELPVVWDGVDTDDMLHKLALLLRTSEMTHSVGSNAKQLVNFRDICKSV